jgi:Arc/MetJ-type ribon-helix-helix transcriptional regulator
MMKAQRDKRRVGNEMPKPMHPPRTTPVTLPAAEPDLAPSAEPPAITEQAAAEVHAGEAAPAVDPAWTSPTPPATKRAAGPRKAVKSDTPTALYPTTAYLELEEDQYIRRTIDAGRYGKPKVTSASAIIRYAVQHLAKTMTPEQVVAAIREAAPETTNQGRIRL